MRRTPCLAALLPAIALLMTVGRGHAELPQVPNGYSIELVADSPLVEHPMLGCFDDRGRLFICESAGTNRPAAELIDDPQDRILMLEDLDGDGVFDKSTVFADRMVFPQGCLWYRGALYTCSSPYLWKLEDTDDDGVCDERTILVKSFGFSGNAADIHGPFLSPDGRLFWCDGRHGHEIRDLGDGEFGGEDTVAKIEPDPEPGLPNPEGSLLTKGKAARIFSCWPDGSDVQVHCGGGMDNPVEVDFWETGECIGTVNLFYGRPRGDCLVHWVEGGVYPRFDQQACIDEFPSTGELLREVHNYGHVAVSGMTRYRSHEFFGNAPEIQPTAGGSDPGDNSPTDQAHFFVTQFNTHKVVHTILQRHGATFRHIATEDFFVSDDPDSHPTDVIEDADGSLLVIDTGGWFRIGCPTSQIAKPEISGAIYRIRKDGAHQDSDDTIDASPERFVTSLKSQFDSDGDWRTSLGDPSESARIAAVASLNHDEREAGTQGDMRAALGRLIADDTLAVSRAAADSLASIQHRERGEGEIIVRYLMNGLRRPDIDRVLEHALVSSLIRFADDNTKYYLDDESPVVRRAALIALDQMEGGELTREQVLPLLETNDPALQKTVLDVISRRDGWAAETTTLLAAWLTDELTDERAAILRNFLSAQAADPAVQQLTAEAVASSSIDHSARSVLLEVMQAAGTKVDQLPDSWITALESLLDADDVLSRRAAMRIAAGFGSDRFDARLERIADDANLSAELRVEALAALGPRLPEVSTERFRFLAHQITTPEDPLARLSAAHALAAVPLDSAQLRESAALFAEAGPLAAPVLLEAFTSSQRDDAMRVLITALSKDENALAAVPQQELAHIIRRSDEELQALAEPLLAKLDVDVAGQQEKLQNLLSIAEGGDPGRGHYVFFGEIAACSRCHRVGDKGERIGPDLTKIAAIRQPRDLLESIVFPSASFARDFEPYIVLLEDGRVVNDLIVRETAEEIVLQTTDLREIRIRRSDVEEMRQSPTSIMPQGLETKLSEEQLRDLMAFLQSLK